jgi:hypothetical protein
MYIVVMFVLMNPNVSSSHGFSQEFVATSRQAAFHRCEAAGQKILKTAPRSATWVCAAKDFDEDGRE